MMHASRCSRAVPRRARSREKARSAFKRALAIDPDAGAAVEAPPKIENLFAKAKGELRPLDEGEPAKTSPQEPSR